jgi:cell shape-determining protein MreC
MFSLIQKVLQAAQSFDAVSRRVTKIESALAEINTKLERFEKLADENESLWEFLDEQKEMDGVFVGSLDEFESEISEMMIRNMKTQGDA